MAIRARIRSYTRLHGCIIRTVCARTKSRRQLNISRASVAMYLRKARETGIVNISTSTQLFAEDVLARQLEDAFELDAGWVVPAAPIPWIRQPTSRLVAASVFLELVNTRRPHRRRLGPHRLHHCRRQMPHADLQGVTVVQLCGNLGAPYSYRPDQCTMEIARRLNAKGMNFYAPLVLTQRRAGCRSLRAEPVIREQLDEHRRLRSCAFFDRHGRRGQPYGQMRRATLRRDGMRCGTTGAAGVIAGQIIDGNGRARSTAATTAA